MAFKATKEQSLAINEKGNILVSAAAGSGKTAVLVERVISMLTDKNSNISADELLIVTFTNAAAAEMRSRIEKRLDEECRKNPLDTGLLMQKHLLNNAKICTIDSFCIDLVRENFDKLDISPDFKICDAYSLRKIDKNVVYQIINRYFEEKNPVFFELLDIVGAEYDEKRFAETVLSIYEYSRHLPFPTEWFKSLSVFYNNGEFTKDNPWYLNALCKAEGICNSMLKSLANLIDILSPYEEIAEIYIPIFSDTAKQVNNMLESRKDWDEFYNSLQEFSPLSLPTIKGTKGNTDFSAVKAEYKYLTEEYPKKLKKIFYADFTFINSQFKKLCEPVNLLSQILIEFEQKLFEAYKNSNQFTFHNTEHLALKLLCKYENGKVVANPDSADLLNRFSEVMVDEYQDTNDLQDMLFCVLSDFEKKLFAVGDVKQSIYAFRGANPTNFLSKKDRYIDIETAKDSEPKKIILGNNFRSKPEVCDFINFVFSLFMQTQTGDIDYKNGEQLIPSAVYPETETNAVEYDLIDCANTKENSLVLEARHIADKIVEIIDSKECIRTKENTLRKAKYSDFTILLRSMTNKAPVIVNELKNRGIPVNLNLESYADSTEISTFLALLKVIDNPKSDVELLTVMLGPIFNFTADQLAEIRYCKPKSSLYSAVIFSAQNGDEYCKEFLKTIEKYRSYSAVLNLPNLISKLLIVTEYLNIASAMSDGERRKNNLLLLKDYAEQYSQGKSGNLSGFIKFITDQSGKGIKSAVGSADNNAVNIMSIHASKGLQFPICILASTASRFNDQESREGCIYSTDLGIGFNYFDEDDKTKYTTISRQMILENDIDFALQEELRLLYVALTRTEDKLIMVSSFSNLQKKLECYKNWLLTSNSKINYSLFARTKSYADWLILASLLHPCGTVLRQSASGILPIEDKCNFAINIIDGAKLNENLIDYANEEIIVNSDLAEKIKENMAYSYPYSSILNVEAKSSASVIANKAESAKYAFSTKPSFLSAGGLMPTQRGTAMHKVMQFIDFDKCNDLEAEIERLYEWQFISEAEMNSLNKKALNEFFASDIFRRIKNSPLVKREMRFLTEVPATEIDNTLDNKFVNEKVIIQGAVDICFIEDNEVVILDFKTDNADDINDLKTAYSEQLNIYGIACEKIFEKPIKEKLIYSFKFSDTIKI